MRSERVEITIIHVGQSGCRVIDRTNYNNEKQNEFKTLSATCTCPLKSPIRPSHLFYNTGRYDSTFKGTSYTINGRIHTFYYYCHTYHIVSDMSCIQQGNMYMYLATHRSNRFFFFFFLFVCLFFGSTRRMICMHAC